MMITSAKSCPASHGLPGLRLCELQTRDLTFLEKKHRRDQRKDEVPGLASCALPQAPQVHPRGRKEDTEGWSEVG